MPKSGATPEEQIQCYNLPFGGLGMLSHILTFYTAIMLLLGRTPLLPSGKRLRFSWVELTLAILTLLGSVPISIITIYSCRDRWEYACIAVWKLTLSIALAAINSHQGTVIFRHHRQAVKEKKTTYTNPRSNSGRVRAVLSRLNGPKISIEVDWSSQSGAYWWLSAYTTGTVIGVVGLIPLVIDHYDHHFTPGIKVMSNLFAMFVGFPIVLWLLCITYWIKKRAMISSFVIVLVWIGLFTAIYADWVLAGIARNWGGLPSSDIALLFWIYFAAKRLPMFSV
jgi:hypothetical protein